MADHITIREVTGLARWWFSVRQAVGARWPWRLPRTIYRTIEDHELQRLASNRMVAGYLFDWLPPRRVLKLWRGAYLDTHPVAKGNGQE